MVSGVQILREEFSRLALSTLAASTFLLGSGVYSTALDRSFLMTKIEFWASVEGLTAGEGALAVCVVDGDITSAQLAAVFDARVSDNMVQKAADQKVKAIALLPSAAALGMPIHHEVTFGKGVPFEELKGWKFGVFNLDTASAMSTGGIAHGTLKVTGVWL